MEQNMNRKKVAVLLLLGALSLNGSAYAMTLTFPQGTTVNTCTGSTQGNYTITWVPGGPMQGYPVAEGTCNTTINGSSGPGFGGYTSDECTRQAQQACANLGGTWH
jgi:hypothetical protein